MKYEFVCLEGCGEKISCRNFLTLAGASVAGATLSNAVFAQQKTDKTAQALIDSNISHSLLTFDSDGANIDSFLTRPKKEKLFPAAVIVIYGHTDLPEEIRNTTAVLAQAGFVGFAIS